MNNAIFALIFFIGLNAFATDLKPKANVAFKTISNEGGKNLQDLRPFEVASVEINNPDLNLEEVQKKDYEPTPSVLKGTAKDKDGDGSLRAFEISSSIALARGYTLSQLSALLNENDTNKMVVIYQLGGRNSSTPKAVDIQVVEKKP